MTRGAVRAGLRVAFSVLWVILLPVLGCGAEESRNRGASASEAAPEKPRKPAPSFELKGADGSPVALAEHRGKPVVIDFWATWCVPCIYQVPELNAFWERHREAADVAVIGVAVDVEGASVVAPWIEEKGVQYQIAIGDEGLAREFGVMGFPTLAIIDSAGNIVSLHVGLIEVEELERLVAPLIGSAQPHETTLQERKPEYRVCATPQANPQDSPARQRALPSTSLDGIPREPQAGRRNRRNRS